MHNLEFVCSWDGVLFVATRLTTDLVAAFIRKMLRKMLRVIKENMNTLSKRVVFKLWVTFGKARKLRGVTSLALSVRDFLKIKVFSAVLFMTSCTL